MTNTDILHHRLINQHIAHTPFSQAQQLVAYMGAMQVQDYAHARWAIGLRLPGVTGMQVDQAFNEGAILRTHLMRPTWHFVAPADIRWLLQLTAQRVHAVNAYMYRREALDATVFKKSNDAIAKALEGGNHLNRAALKSVLEQKKIIADGVRLACLLMYAELEGIMCSGPREGKQFTCALLDERVPADKSTMSKGEAAATLALRYFTSRGPATLKDFAWWSGLNIKDAKEGIAALPGNFSKLMTGGQEYIFAPTGRSAENIQAATFLMPNFDEYGISYKDRDILKGDAKTHMAISRNGISVPSLVIDGQIAGTWRVARQKNITTVATDTYAPLTNAKQHAVKHAADRYIAFMDGI